MDQIYIFTVTYTYINIHTHNERERETPIYTQKRTDLDERMLVMKIASRCRRRSRCYDLRSMDGVMTSQCYDRCEGGVVERERGRERKGVGGE